MKAFLYVGGAIRADNITEKPRGGDLVIAADSGLLNAKALGAKPSILLGDFDSLDEPDEDPEVKIVRLPAEKDVTDTQAAVSLALEKGADEIVIIGGLSGRLDHTLSVLAVLEDLDARHVHALATDGQNRARFLRNNSTLIARSGFRYLSLIAADPVVKGITLEGCKYPLKKARLVRTHQYAISNELTGNCALIDIRRGGVWILETAD